MEIGDTYTVYQHGKAITGVIVAFSDLTLKLPWISMRITLPTGNSYVESFFLEARLEPKKEDVTDEQ